jgi:D-serine deaminase-like pyridoxal phosphate-dependent protein
MQKAVQLLSTQGFADIDISTGGTPDMWQSQAKGVFTEYRAGTYIYNDRSLMVRGTCKEEDCAGIVVARVVSRPTKTRIVIDAGSKTLTTDLLGLDGYGYVINHPDAQIVSLSEEHGTMQVNDQNDLQIGDMVKIIPNHVCVVSNLFDNALVLKTSGELVPLPIDARGCVS